MKSRKYFTGKQMLKLMSYQSFSRKDFWDRIRNWLYSVREITYSFCEKYGIDKPTFYVQNKGRPRYMKIIMEHIGQKRIFCLIDRINGDIRNTDFASRGNIFDEHNGLSMVEPFGIKNFRVRENPLYKLHRKMHPPNQSS
jgi:hypothetical protein